MNLESIPAVADEMDVVLAAGWPRILLHETMGHGLAEGLNRKDTLEFSGLIGEHVIVKGVTVVNDGKIEK